MSEECGAFARRALLERRSDGLPETVDGTCSGLAQNRLDLGEELFDRVEIWAVGRELGNSRPAGFDRFADTWNLVNADIIHDDDITARQRGREHLFDIGLEALAIHRSIQQQGCGNAIMAQGGDECHRFPMAMRHFADEPLTTRSSAVEARHACGCRSFVDEDKPRRVKQTLFSAPRLPRRSYVGPILLGRV